MTRALLHSFACMGTVVTLQVVGEQPTAADAPPDVVPELQRAAVARAEGWFRHIETSCNRFDPNSEVRQLSECVGRAQPASMLLIHAVQFALAVAQESGGAFDPTVGQRMEARGFDRAYQTGLSSRSTLTTSDGVTYRDVSVNAHDGTITLQKRLLLDLGAVAKGLAIDMAARELAPLENFQINAGGDVYVGGRNASGDPWRVGIRHPRATDTLITTLRVSNCAVCTSGDYERRSDHHADSASDVHADHHIMNARTGDTARELASVTVMTSSAMVADALATAAFALGPSAGLALLKRHGVEGLLVTPALEQFATKGLPVV